MKKFYILLLVVGASFATNAQTIIAQWNFDAATPAAAMLPTTGAGTFTLIGGVEDNLTSGAMPAGNPSTGKAYSIKTFPDQGIGSGTAGFQFAVSTANYTGISVSFDPRGSGTASKWQQYEYSTNGTSWTVVGNNSGGLLNDFTVNVNLPLPAAAANSANLRFRIVSIFEPGTSAYAPVGTSYGTGGAWRIDNVTFRGTTLGVAQNAISGLSVYPNPVVDGNLFITSDSAEAKTVLVYDILGKQVVKATVTDQPINVSNLKGGVYIVKITEEGKTATRKLIIR